MLHFFLGIVLGIVAGTVARHFGQSAMVILIVGAAVAALYWLIVATCKGKIPFPDIDFDI